jgi:P4 family phage/plasmid primase-like protien
MTELPTIDLRLAQQQVRIFHRLAESCAGRGGLLLRSGGLDPMRREPLPATLQRFVVGAVDPMVDMAVRLNRQPGRNLDLPLAVFGDDGDEILGVFGFAVELARAPGWLTKVPYAPTGALAAGDKVWAVYLLDRPEAAGAVLPLAQQVRSFAVAHGGIDLRRGVPLAGGIHTAAAGRPDPVELELPWRPPYSLAQLSAQLGAEGSFDRPPRRVSLEAVRPENIPGDIEGGGDAAAAEQVRGGSGADADAAAADDLALRFGRFALWLRASQRRLEIGSDVEIAQRISRELATELGPVVHAEGESWFYAARTGCWTAIPPDLSRRLVHAFDGAAYPKPNGKIEIVQLSKSRCDSIMHEVAAILAAPDFFKDAAAGINVANGLIAFLPDGTPELLPHRPEHRQRHVIAGKWDKWMAEEAEDPPEGSLLHGLLHGCFAGDPDIADKIRLVGELAGAAATGCMTKLRQKKAFIFKGSGADNGKSQLLDLLRAMLPAAAVGAVPPNKFGDEKYLIHLRGKLLNARDELTSAKVVGSDIFKTVVTGEPISGRDVYRSMVQFRSIALHVFATNVLPSFSGGFDRGVRRRLAMLAFNRSIPRSEQIVDLGRRVAAEETDLLLAFAVAGAARLLRQKGFTEPASSQAELQDWFTSGDPVAAFVAARVRPRDQGEYLPGTKDRGMRSAEVFAEFDRWSKANGYKTNIQITGFVPRFRAVAPYVKKSRSGAANRLRGFVIAEADFEAELDEELEGDGG